MNGKPRKMTYAESTRYWTSPPPEPSEGLTHWKRRVEQGFRRNRRLSGMSYGEAAEYFGVYHWEWFHVLSDLMDAAEAKPYPANEAWRHGRSYGPAPRELLAATLARDAAFKAKKRGEPTTEDPAPQSPKTE